MIELKQDDDALTDDKYPEFLEAELWRIGKAVADSMYHLAASEKNEDAIRAHNESMMEPVSKMIMLHEVVKMMNKGSLFKNALKHGINKANEHEKQAEEMTDAELVELRKKLGELNEAIK